MQYLLLIYGSEDHESTMTPEEHGQYMADFGTFTQSIVESGQFKAGEALHPVATARSVRIRGGDTTITHGPFAETTEALGGFYLVEAADIDEACAIAARIPTSKYGTIEVRPIMVWTDGVPEAYEAE